MASKTQSAFARGPFKGPSINAGPFGKQASKGNISMQIPGEVDEMLGECYRRLVTLKLEMDAMEEVPNWLKNTYKQTMDSMNKIGKIRQDVYNMKMNLIKEWKRLA